VFEPDALRSFRSTLQDSVSGQLLWVVLETVTA